MAKQLGATDCLNPKDYDKPIQQVEILDEIFVEMFFFWANFFNGQFLAGTVTFKMVVIVFGNILREFC